MKKSNGSSVVHSTYLAVDENIISERIDKLKHFSKRRLKETLFGIVGLVCTSSFSIISLLSIGIAVLENYDPEILLSSGVSSTFTFFFLLIIYITGILIPVMCGYQLISGTTLVGLSICTGFLLYLGFAFDQRFTGSLLFVLIGIILGWIAEITSAIGIIFIYSYWRFFGVLLSVFLSALTVSLFTKVIADLPNNFKVTNFDIVLSFLGMIFLLFASVVIARKSIRENENFNWFYRKAISFAALGGVSFYGLDLTKQNFDGLDLSHTDFRNTKLYSTSFRGADLKHARIEGTILESQKVRDLLTLPFNKELSNKDFSNTDLSGAYLHEMNLEGSNFLGANLVDVNFSKANLNGSIFSYSQLYNANFSGASLTGICIHNWAINHQTCFENVQCSWIYLRQGKYGPLEKKPDIGEFQAGEFEKWIRQLQDTIDLILREQPNVRALVAAIERVAHSYDGLDPSRFSIESKGDDLYIARVGTTPEADKEKVASTIIVNYNSINELMIQGESNRLLLNSAGNYMENQNQNINAGGNLDMSSGTRVSIGGDVTGSSITLGDLNGQVSNTIQSIRDIEQGDNQSLAEILGALQSAINADQALSEPQKLQAMQAVDMLAKEADKPKKQRLPEFCLMAMNSLKGITSTITDASKLVDMLKTHLPTLVKLLGI